MKSRILPLFIFLAAPSLVLAQKTWVGKAVILKEGEIEIHNTDASGDRVSVATLTGSEYRVEAEDDNFVQIRQEGVSGWLPKAKAILADEAVDYFTRAIRQNPMSSESYHRRGAAWKYKNDSDKAIKDYNEAIRLNPKFAFAYGSRAKVYLDMRDYDKAISDYDEAIRLNPKFASAFNGRGNAYNVKKTYDKAISSFDEAIRLNPKYSSAYNNRGNACEARKEYEKALGDYNEAIRLDPNSPIAYSNRGLVYVDKKDYKKAISDYEEAIRLEPGFAFAYNGLAWVLATCPADKYRNGTAAVQHAKKACELSNWKDGGFMDTLAAAYAEIGRFDEAVKWQKKALEDAAEANENGNAMRKHLALYQNKKPYRNTGEDD